MATVRATVKRMMFEYPTLFPNPVNALVHLFTTLGGGYEWYNGELVDRFTEETGEPVFKHEPYNRNIDTYFQHLATGYELQNEAFAVRCQFVEKNIDRILEAPLTNVYFGTDPKGHYFIKGICTGPGIVAAQAFRFPKNITKDWGEVLYEFLEYWQVRLNSEYGVSPTDLWDRSFWPKNIVEAADKIQETKERLYPLMHDGETYAEMKKRTREFFDSIKNELKE